MKHIYYYIIITCSLFIFSCNEEAGVLQVKDEAGLIIDISSSSGSLLGFPSANAETEQSTITITEALLSYTVNLSSGNIDNIDKFELVKSFSGDINNSEIIVSDISELPFTYTLNNIDEFLDGFEIDKSTLKIEDSFTFKLKVHQKDGDIFYYDASKNFTLTLEDPSINDVLNITTSWDNTYTHFSNGTSLLLEACNEVDFDIYLYDLNYNFIATIAESSDCPETGIISGLEDGKYMIGVYLYDNNLFSYNLNQTLPLTITYYQNGFIEESNFINTEFSTNDAWDDYKEVIVAEIEVENGYLYTITPQ